MLSEPNISYKPFWGICRPLKSWRANSPNPIQIYCANFSGYTPFSINCLKAFCTYSLSSAYVTPNHLSCVSSTFTLIRSSLGKSKDVLKYICLSFISFLPLFYFCCIYYFGSLIFCCQFVAISL